MNPLCIAPQTVVGLGPVALLRLAEELDLDHVSLRLIPGMEDDPTPDMTTDPALQREVRARLRSIRAGLLDVEVVRVTGDLDRSRTGALLDTAAAIGATRIVSSGNDTDASRMSDNFLWLAERAASLGITLSIEHAPYTALRTAGDVLELIRALDIANATVLTDPLHVSRSGDSAASLKAIAPELLPYADFCDAPAAIPSFEKLMPEARGGRLYPGEGGLDLHAFLDALPPTAALRLEVPRRNDLRPITEKASDAIAAARRLLNARPLVLEVQP